MTMGSSMNQPLRVLNAANGSGSRLMVLVAALMKATFGSADAMLHRVALQ